MDASELELLCEALSLDETGVAAGEIGFDLHEVRNQKLQLSLAGFGPSSTHRTRWKRVNWTDSKLSNPSQASLKALGKRPMGLKALWVGNRPKRSKVARGRRFQFEACWAEEQECREIVKGRWSSGNNAAALDSVLEDIFSCSGALNDWNIKRRKG
ncbi:hypothetical protein ACOSP7_004842 [Xanthoceras sorbifolium]